MTNGFVLSVAAALGLWSYLVGVKRYLSHYPPALFISLTYVVAVVWYLPAAALTVQTERLVPTVSLWGAVVPFETAGFTALALFAFYRSSVIGDVSYVTSISKPTSSAP